MQKLICVGNLVRDPQAKSDNGKNTARFTVAVNEYVGGSQKATFFNCIAFGKKAELVVKYLRKGQPVQLCGRVWASTFKGRNGLQASLNLAVEDIAFIKGTGQKRQEQSQSQYNSPASQEPCNDGYGNDGGQQFDYFDGGDDDIPF